MTGRRKGGKSKCARDSRVRSSRASRARLAPFPPLRNSDAGHAGQGIKCVTTPFRYLISPVICVKGGVRVKVTFALFFDLCQGSNLAWPLIKMKYTVHPIFRAMALGLLGRLAKILAICKKWHVFEKEGCISNLIRHIKCTKLSFCTFCFYLPTKMLYLNTPLSH